MEQKQHKRRFPRIPSENVVLFQKIGADADEELAKTGMVGLGGCMIRSKVSVGEGSIVSLLISVSDHVLKTEARVVYEKVTASGEYEVGVEFLSLAPADRKRLAELLGEED